MARYADLPCSRRATSVQFHVKKIFPTLTMDVNEQNEIEAKCEQFLKELGVPGFIVFGWRKQNEEFGVVSSYHEMPKNVAIKAMSWALHDFANKAL